MLKLSYTKKIIFNKKCKIGLTTKFEGRNSIGNDSSVLRSYIGYSSYINSFSNIYNTKIGKFTSIGSKVDIVIGNHPTSIFVSTHPVFYSLLKQTGVTYTDKQIFSEYKYVDEKCKYSVIIGNDVWIAHGVTILEGVTTGDGAIIAVNSTVNKDVEPYSIYGGTPCKKIKNRFSQDQIEFLLQFKWWNKSNEWIEQNSKYFTNIDEFIKMFKKDV